MILTSRFPLALTLCLVSVSVKGALAYTASTYTKTGTYKGPSAFVRRSPRSGWDDRRERTGRYERESSDADASMVTVNGDAVDATVNATGWMLEDEDVTTMTSTSSNDVSSNDASSNRSGSVGDMSNHDESVEVVVLPPLNDSDEEAAMIPLSPPLSFRKFITMQGKRVVVSLVYTEKSGLWPFFLTTAKRIKAAFPDVLIEKKVLPLSSTSSSSSGSYARSSFEVVVDGKVVVGHRKGMKKNSSAPKTKTPVFVSMQEVEAAIVKARKKKRPSTLYNGTSRILTSSPGGTSGGGTTTNGDVDVTAVRAEMLRNVVQRDAVRLDMLQKIIIEENNQL